MASASLRCPKCETVLKLANRPPEGKKVRCPHCAAVFKPSDDEADDSETAIKTKPDQPVPVKKKATRLDAEAAGAGRGRKSRPEMDDDDDRPRKSKGKRPADDDDDDDANPRRKAQKKPASKMGLLIGLGVGAFAFLLILGVVGGGAAWWLLARGGNQVAKGPPPIVEQGGKDPIDKGPVVIKKEPENKKEPPKDPEVNEQPKIKQKKKNVPPPPPPEPEPEPILVAGPVDLDPNLIAKVSRATALVRTDLGNLSSSGSGFMVRTAGDTAYIITNVHVIDIEPSDQPKAKGPKGPPFGPGGFPKKGQPKAKERARITVVLNSGTPEEQSFPADIVAFDQEGDLAALRISGARNLPEAIDVSQEVPVAETQPVYFFGFPARKAPKGAGNPKVSVGKGTISGLRRDANNELIDVHINGQIIPGNSGGPVVDAQGKLVGVAVAAVPGKQIGFAIPAGELLQMFKGRVANGLVAQVKQQGARADLVGELWVHDRKSSVRGRDVITASLGAIPKGSAPIPTDEFTVLARLADPMLKISAASAYFAVTEDVPGAPDAKGWTPLLKATPIVLKIQDQVAVGTFKLPMGTVADQTFAFQFSYVNADKQTIYTQPHLVRLTFPKNTKSVTINISGIPNEPTLRYLEDTTPKQFSAKVKVKSKSKNALTLEVDPVPDPSVIERQIKFGKVTSVQGRTFEVACNAIALPAPTAAEIDSALAELKGPDEKRGITAADRLAKVYVVLPERRAEVAKALEAKIAAKDGWLGKAVLRALKVWAGPEQIPAMAAVTENWFLRAESLQALAQLKDPAAATALAKHLPSLGDRAFVSASLKSMGPVAEKAVIPYVNDKDGWAAREACQILQIIGTKECLPTLTAMANSDNNFVNGLARDALKAVQARAK